METGPAIEGADPILIQHSNKDTVEQKIMENNENRFRLMESTPPMNEPLLSDLGDATKHILNGTYICPEGVDAYTKNFIASLQITTPINPADFIPNTVSLQDYQAHWKRITECTSSSISGLHFGHWKAAAESNFLSELHALFTDIIVSTSYSPVWWQQGLLVMLEKKKGVCIPSKLHAILLMDANFNFPNKLFFGQHMLQWAESRNQIPQEIGGSQNGHQTIDCAINQVLTLDAFRQKRISGAVTSMDADTCYDHMAHSMISLCSQCLALVVEVITSLLLTIQLMKFFLQTAFGDSTCFYGSWQPIPLQGCCQGNGGGPAMWVSVSIILVHQLWANGHIAMFIQVISGLKVSFAGFLYVDDGAHHSGTYTY